MSARDDLARLSLSDLLDWLERREVSSVEATRGCLERIDALDEELNAFITILADAALAEAERADERRARGEMAPLLGAPVALKDLFATAGIRTTGGSRLLRDNVPDTDATVTRRLREAGAVLLGKTNMMELAYGYPHPDYGETRNPWDAMRTARGSSGGSAAAVPAGMASAALGSDTGGSIRSPAAYCGVVGLKPTYGAISRSGVIPLAWSLDHAGPLTRAVRDSAILFDVLAGHDPADPASARLAHRPAVPRLDTPAGGARVGVVEELYQRHVQPEVRRVTMAATERLRDAGFELVPVTLAHAHLTTAAIMPIVQAEATSYHWHDLTRRPGDFSDALRENLRLGALVLAKDYLDAQRVRRVIAGEVTAALAGVDALIFPTQPIVAPPIGAYDVAEEGEEDVLDVEIGHTGLANLSGHPAISLPCGLTADGLPVGLQLTGRAFDEATLLRIAHQTEAALAGWDAEGIDARTNVP